MTGSGPAVVVTGVARDIGRAIAVRYAEAGARVVVDDLDRAGTHLVADHYRRRADDNDGCLAGMHRLQQKTEKELR